MYDHMDFVLTSLDMFAGIAENLINYAFNVRLFPSLVYLLIGVVDGII